MSCQLSTVDVFQSFQAKMLSVISGAAKHAAIRMHNAIRNILSMIVYVLLYIISVRQNRVCFTTGKEMKNFISSFLQHA